MIPRRRPSGPRPRSPSPERLDVILDEDEEQLDYGEPEDNDAGLDHDSAQTGEPEQQQLQTGRQTVGQTDETPRQQRSLQTPAEDRQALGADRAQTVEQTLENMSYREQQTPVRQFSQKHSASLSQIHGACAHMA